MAQTVVAQWLSVAAAMLLPIALLLLQLIRNRRRAPGWRDIDPAILKVGGTRKKLEAVADDTDVVVIGSGLGGLTSASLLAKAGYKVVVLEQHDIAGGCTHTFEDGGFEFDVGIHYLGGQLDRFRSSVRRLWSVASDGKLEWTPSDPTYDVCFNSKTGERIPFTASTSDNDSALLRHFGAKQGADTAGLAAALKWYHRYELVGWMVAILFYCFKALPPLVLRLVWPFFSPLWRWVGAVSVKTIMERCGFKGNVTELGGALTYLYGRDLLPLPPVVGHERRADHACSRPSRHFGRPH